MLDEVTQQFEFARRQFNRLAVTKHLSTAEIHAVRTKFVGTLLCTPPAASACASQQGLNSSEQFHHLERLGQIIVSPEFQSNDLIDNLAFGRQHQDGRLNSLLPKVPTDIKTAAV